MMRANRLADLLDITGAEQGCRAGARYRNDGAIGDLQANRAGQTNGFLESGLTIAGSGKIIRRRLLPPIAGAIAPSFGRQVRMNDAGDNRRSDIS